MQRPHEEYHLTAWLYKVGLYTAKAIYDLSGFEWSVVYEGEAGFWIYAQGKSISLAEARRMCLETLHRLSYNVLAAKGKGAMETWSNPEQHHGR